MKSNWLLTDEQKQAICTRYMSGETVASLARDFGVRNQSVHSLLKRRGVEMRPNFYIEVSEELAKACVQHYEAGESTGQIAARYTLQASQINRILKRQGVQLRKAGPLRKYFYDETFFEQLGCGDGRDEQRAYWLGFITADGCVSQSGHTWSLKVGLHPQDSRHLEKLLQELGSPKTPIREVTQKVVLPSGMERVIDSVRVDVCSRRIVSSLNELGIVPRKSHTVQPWIGPNDLMRHYWRGVVDGDGFIYLNSPYGIGLVGSEAIAKGFASFIEQSCDVPVFTLKPYSSIWTCRVGGKKKASRLAEVLYGDATVFLDRKYVSAMRLLELKRKGASIA